MTDLGSRFAQAEEKGRKKQLILANLLIVDTLYLSWYFVLVKLLKARFILNDNNTGNLLANLLIVDTLYLAWYFVFVNLLMAQFILNDDNTTSQSALTWYLILDGSISFKQQ